jgi:hypothetical protein
MPETPNLKRKLIDIQPGDEFSSPKAFANRVEDYGCDSKCSIVLNKPESSRHRLIYVCSGRSAGTPPKNCCQFRIEANVSRRNNDAVTVSVALLKHNEYCVPVVPVPSFRYLQNHAELVAFSVHNKCTRIIEYAKRAFQLNISKNYASRLHKYSQNTQQSANRISYTGIPSFLEYLRRKNPGVQYKVVTDKDNRFESAAYIVPGVIPLIRHSFLGTLHVDAGHSVDPDGLTFYIFILSVGDREHRDRPIAYGFYWVESLENYKDFFNLILSDPELFELLNRRGIAIIHDRHRAFLPAVNACFPNALNREDLVHIVKNTKVCSLFKLWFHNHLFVVFTSMPCIEFHCSNT